jgi:hypothetical protein
MTGLEQDLDLLVLNPGVSFVPAFLWPNSSPRLAEAALCLHGGGETRSSSLDG